jgi:hypothetical protein
MENQNQSKEAYDMKLALTLETTQRLQRLVDLLQCPPGEMVRGFPRGNRKSRSEYS